MSRVRVVLSYGFGEDLFGGLDPDEGLRTIIPCADEAVDRFHQGVDASEAATPNRL